MNIIENNTIFDTTNFQVVKIKFSNTIKTNTEFEEIKKYSEQKNNIISAECGPMVRSSYHAESQLKNAKSNLEKGVIN